MKTDEELFQNVQECLKKLTVEKVRKAFTDYCRDAGYKKKDPKNKNNAGTYFCSVPQDYGGNKMECYILGKSGSYGDFALQVVLRKRAGYYLIIAGTVDDTLSRVAEVQFAEAEKVHFEPDRLRALIKMHEPFFTALGLTA